MTVRIPNSFLRTCARCQAPLLACTAITRACRHPCMPRFICTPCSPHSRMACLCPHRYVPPDILREDRATERALRAIQHDPNLFYAQPDAQRLGAWWHGIVGSILGNLPLFLSFFSFATPMNLQRPLSAHTCQQFPPVFYSLLIDVSSLHLCCGHLVLCVYESSLDDIDAACV